MQAQQTAHAIEELESVGEILHLLKDELSEYINVDEQLIHRIENVRKLLQNGVVF